jgi:osmotically-inducible protein OsmY
MDGKHKVEACVGDELRECKVDRTKMCACVVDGIVSLRGEVPILDANGRAQQAVRMAQAALSAVSPSIALPPGGIEVVVHDGIMKLIGEVDADYQRQAAIMAVTSVPGVKEVVSRIVVRARGGCHSASPAG